MGYYFRYRVHGIDHNLSYEEAVRAAKQRAVRLNGPTLIRGFKVGSCRATKNYKVTPEGRVTKES